MLDGPACSCGTLVAPLSVVSVMSPFAIVERSMRKYLLKATLAVAAFVALPGSARADSPNLSGYTFLPTVFYAAIGVTSFDVQFLFGRQGYSSSLFYQDTNLGGWTKILSTQGAYPNQTTSPAPGTVFANLAIVGTGQEVKFGICSNTPAPATFANCTQPLLGPFTTGLSATNVRTLTGAQWNTERAAITPDGANSIYNTVFAFEDQSSRAQYYDGDFNDVVFSTNLATTVPEPTTVALMAFGMLGLAAAARRRRSV